MRKLLVVIVFSLLLVGMMGCLGGDNKSSTNDSQIVIDQGNASNPMDVGAISVSIKKYPSEVTAGEDFKVTWYVDSPPQKTGETALLYDTKSIPYPTAPSNYLYSTAKNTATFPQLSVENLKFDKPGTYYIRPYARIDGQLYWGNERIITVNPKESNEVNTTNDNLEVINVSVSDKVSVSLIKVKVSKEVILNMRNDRADYIVADVPSVGKVQISPLEVKQIHFVMAPSYTIVRVFDNNDNVLGEVRFAPIGG